MEKTCSLPRLHGGSAARLTTCRGLRSRCRQQLIGMGVGQIAFELLIRWLQPLGVAIKHADDIAISRDCPVFKENRPVT